jgi:hypothetical protein
MSVRRHLTHRCRTKSGSVPPAWGRRRPRHPPAPPLIGAKPPPEAPRRGRSARHALEQRGVDRLLLLDEVSVGEKGSCACRPRASWPAARRGRAVCWPEGLATPGRQACRGSRRRSLPRSSAGRSCTFPLSAQPGTSSTRMVPMQVRRKGLHRASSDAAAWLARLLTHRSTPFRTRIQLSDGRMRALLRRVVPSARRAPSQG